MKDLRPCPFCGGVAELKAPGYEHYSPCWVKCTQCGAEGPTKSSEEEAEKGWNERAQEVRELTIDEWRKWKANPNRDPICRLWEGDTSPMWTLNPNDVHEPALLMGKLKLFTDKPTFEQCKEVKWG